MQGLTRKKVVKGCYLKKLAKCIVLNVLYLNNSKFVSTNSNSKINCERVGCLFLGLLVINIMCMYSWPGWKWGEHMNWESHKNRRNCMYKLGNKIFQNILRIYLNCTGMNDMSRECSAILRAPFKKLCKTFTF